MMLFFRHTTMLTLLPDCLSSNIVGEWLDAFSLLDLDFAYCSHSARENFCRILANTVLSRVEIYNTAMVIWLLKRKLAASSICFSSPVGNDGQAIVAKFCKLNDHRIRCIHLESDESGYIYTIKTNCHHLHILKLNFSVELRLAKLFAQNEKLETVDVLLADESLAECKTLCLPNLKTLSATICKPNQHACFEAILKAAPRLQKLSIVEAILNDDAPLFETPLSQLVYLLLPNKLRADSMVLCAVQRCPRIMHLDLSSCYRLTDTGVLNFIRHTPLLRSLNLIYCSLLTNKALEHIANYVSNTLTKLHVGHNQDFTAESFALLQGKCTYLCSFHCVAWVPNETGILHVTTRGIATILECFCCLFDDYYIREYIVHCDSIQIMHLRAPPYLYKQHPTQEVFQELVEKWPSLHTIIASDRDIEELALLAKNTPRLVVTDTCTYPFAT